MGLKDKHIKHKSKSAKLDIDSVLSSTKNGVSLNSFLENMPSQISNQLFMNLKNSIETTGLPQAKISEDTSGMGNIRLKTFKNMLTNLNTDIDKVLKFSEASLQNLIKNNKDI